MKNTVLTILAAVGATLCCTGPVLFTSIGATSLAGFTVLEPLRPYLSIIAIGLLGFAFWRSYRSSTEEACCSLEDKSKLQRQRRTLWITAVVMTVFLAFPYIFNQAVFASGGNLDGGDLNVKKTSTWDIDGMTCSACALGFEASLIREEGMEYCKVRYADGQMDCRVDNSKLVEKGIPDLVTPYGYKVKLTETAPTSPTL